jgi:tricorn protease
VAPAFDPGGNYLYFLSYREFNPVYDNLHFDLSFPWGMRPYLLLLRADLPNPFLPRPDGDDEDDEDDDHADDEDDDDDAHDDDHAGDDDGERGDEDDDADDDDAEDAAPGNGEWRAAIRRAAPGMR